MVKGLRWSTVAPMVCGWLALALLPGCKQEAGSAPAPPVPEVGIVVATAQDVHLCRDLVGYSCRLGFPLSFPENSFVWR